MSKDEAKAIAERVCDEMHNGTCCGLSSSSSRGPPHDSPHLQQPQRRAGQAAGGGVVSDPPHDFARCECTHMAWQHQWDGWDGGDSPYRYCKCDHFTHPTTPPDTEEK